MTDEPDGSAWIEVTDLGQAGRLQHFKNRDGREMWRPLAKPEDRQPPRWRSGPPPASVEPLKASRAPSGGKEA
jgi:hypothetical protein